MGRGNLMTNRPLCAPAWAAALLASALAFQLPAHAQTEEFGRAGNFTVLLERHAPGNCRAIMYDRKHQPDFGEFFAIAFDGRDWQIWTDYRIYHAQTYSITVDGRPFDAWFEQIENVGVASVDRNLIDAIAGGGRISLNLDPDGPDYSLRGSARAIEMLESCARGNGPSGSGIENASDGETNAYGGYDIGGTPEADESRYGSVRGWTVYSATISDNFAYCAGEFDDRGTPWRLGWDGMQWQVAVALDAEPDWSGSLEVDGDSLSISGSAKGGWTLLWLGMPELERIRDGNLMIVDVGRVSIDHRLIGTAAVITKIEECVRRNGGRARAAEAPVSSRRTHVANSGGADCPDDGPRLPFTGICAGRAVNYLGGEATYGDYLPDPACEWVVNEVQIVEDALLYRALRCKGVTAQLEFAGGAQWAQLMVVRSALEAAYGSPVSDPETPLVWFSTIDPTDVERQLDMRSRQGAEAELRGRVCAIRKADPSISPDGYVFDITPADPQYAQSLEEPTGAQCGPFSYGDGSVRFWRVLGDYAFLFDLSADIYQDIDPNTVTLLRKDGSGAWAAVD
jgi:hypothetical protein